MCHNNLAVALSSTSDALTLVQAENMQLVLDNRATAAELMDLAGQLKDHSLADLRDTRLLESLQAAEAQAKEARRQFRIVKGVVSGVVAGSGIDWAGDEQLRNLVLDAED